jgi:hypothetical protein
MLKKLRALFQFKANPRDDLGYRLLAGMKKKDPCEDHLVGLVEQGANIFVQDKWHFTSPVLLIKQMPALKKLAAAIEAVQILFDHEKNPKPNCLNRCCNI